MRKLRGIAAVFMKETPRACKLRFDCRWWGPRVRCARFVPPVPQHRRRIPDEVVSAEGRRDRGRRGPVGRSLGGKAGGDDRRRRPRELREARGVHERPLDRAEELRRRGRHAAADRGRDQRHADLARSAQRVPDARPLQGAPGRHEGELRGARHRDHGSERGSDRRLPDRGHARVSGRNQARRPDHQDRGRVHQGPLADRRGQEDARAAWDASRASSRGCSRRATVTSA
jgi:hypothetical protein